MVEKTFTGYVVLNWRTGNFRAIKRLPKRLKEVEIPIEININCVLPEVQKMKVNGKLELSGVKVKQLILDALENGQFEK